MNIPIKINLIICIALESFAIFSNNIPSVNVYVTSGNASAQTSGVQSTQQSANQSITNIKHSFDFPDSWSMTPIKDYARTTQTKTINFVNNHIWHINLLILTSLYITTYYNIYQINQAICSKTAWCTWKEIIPLTRLATTDIQDLTTQLQFDMYKKYYPIYTLRDIHTVHQYFLKDTNNELIMLKKYLWLQTIFSKFYLNKALPFKYSADNINQYIARLEFIIDLFIDLQLKQSSIPIQCINNSNTVQ